MRTFSASVCCFLALSVSPLARPVGAQTPQVSVAPNLSSVARLMLRVKPKSTLAQVKRALPAGVKLGKPRKEAPYPNQTWNVVPMRGTLVGQLMFFNARPSSTNDFRASDPLHEVVVLVDSRPKPGSRATVGALSSRHIAAFSKIFGQPSWKGRVDPSVDFVYKESYSASWKKPNGRTVEYAPHLSLGFDRDALALVLSFPYTKSYEA